MVYPKWFSSHFAHKSGNDRPDVESIGIIDIHFTAFDSNCGLSSKEHQASYDRHHEAVKSALGIKTNAAYYLPFVANYAINAVLYKNEHGKPIHVFGATAEMTKVIACNKKKVWFGDDNKKGLSHILCRLPHPEVLLRRRLGANSPERIAECDKAITKVFQYVPEVNVEGLESTLFHKIAYGGKETLSEDELQAIYEAMKHVRELAMKGALKRLLKRWTPDSSDEDISNLIASGFDWDALWDQRYVSFCMLLASFLNTNCNQLLT